MTVEAQDGGGRSEHAIVLLSGGLDSAALLQTIIREFRSASALFVNYGQPAANREFEASFEIAKAANLDHEVVVIDGPVEPGEGEIAGRNAVLLSIAFNVMGGRSGVIGLGVHAGTGYADCDLAFVDAMQDVFDHQTKGRVRISAPFVDWTKASVYAYALSCGVPIEITYSCERSCVPCQSCPSCLDRRSLDA